MLALTSSGITSGGNPASVFQTKEVWGKSRYIELYTLLYNHCLYVSPQDQTESKKEQSGGRWECWLRIIQTELKNFWRITWQISAKDGENLTDIGILKFYTQQWEDYQFSSKVLNGICARLNKHLLNMKNKGHKVCRNIFSCNGDLERLSFQAIE